MTTRKSPTVLDARRTTVLRELLPPSAVEELLAPSTRGATPRAGAPARRLIGFKATDAEAAAIVEHTRALKLNVSEWLRGLVAAELADAAAGKERRKRKASKP